MADLELSAQRQHVLKQQRLIRVFISSTFRDMHAERDHLVTVVFPELRERLERLGLEFYDVDLRWGVPQVGADGERANSWAYCKQWIDRSEPFFICMLGQRYGFAPPPDEIRDPDDRAAYQDLSITEMEIRHAAPGGRLRRRSFFYFRQATVPEAAPPAVYREFVDVEAEERLRMLKAEIRASGRPVRSYDCRWQGAGFTDLDGFGQAVLEDLWSGVLRDERYVPKEAWRMALDHDPNTDPLYTEESRPIPAEVWEKIVAYAKPVPPDPLDTEAEQMAAFAASRLRWFQGRERELGQLLRFVDEDLGLEESRLCIVPAKAGQGKSALLAKLAERLSGSPHLLITHFVGATGRSADLRSLLARLDGELDRSGIPRPAEEEPQQDLESLKKRLAARLEGYDANRRLVLIIDGINQLTDGHDLRWLPSRLGANVRIVLSYVDDPSSPTDSPEARVVAALAARRPPPLMVALSGLAEDDVRAIVRSYLQEYCKELDRPDIDAICRLGQARNPLYLLVMLGELRTLGGNDMQRIVPELIARLPEERPDTIALFDWALSRLEVFGLEAVRLWCTYLALGREGMASRELSDLLVRKLGADAAATSLRIERGIRRYLQRRGFQIDFFHGQLRAAVRQRYLQGDLTAHHTEIAGYLETRWREPSSHALSELPYHQAKGQMEPELAGTLCDFHFVAAKCRAGMPFDLLRDSRLAPHLPALAQLGKILSPALPALSSRPDLAIQTLYNRVRWLDAPAPALRSGMEAARSWLDGQNLWLGAEAPLPGVQAMSSSSVAFGFTASVQALAPGGQAIAVLSPSETVEIRNLPDGDLIHSLNPWNRRIAAMALRDDGAGIAYMDYEGVIGCTEADFPLSGRKRERLLAYHTKLGVLAVREDNALVAWRPEVNTSSVLVEDLPAPLLVLRIARDSRSVLFAAGSTRQVIGIATVSGGLWTTRLIPDDGEPVVDADLDVGASRVLLATRWRRLRLLDLASGRESHAVEYERHAEGTATGAPIKCALGCGESQGLAFLATRDGQVVCWDPARDSITRLEDYAAPGQSLGVQVFETILPGGQLFISTNLQGKMLTPHSRYTPATRHVTVVGGCLLTESQKIVSVSQSDNTVRWFSAEGLRPLHVRACERPAAIGPCRSSDDVLIGIEQGHVWRQPPDREVASRYVFMAFAEPVCSLFDAGDGCIVAASRSGKVSRIRVASDTTEILRHSVGRETQLQLLPAGPSGLAWSVRRMQGANGSHSLISLITAAGKEEFVFSTNDLAPDVAVTADGATLCVGGSAVQVIRRERGEWRVVYERQVPVSHVAILGGGVLLAVVLQESPWLELWRVAAGLPEIAAIDLPLGVTALAAAGDRLAVGLASGELMSISVQGKSVVQGGRL